MAFTERSGFPTSNAGTGVTTLSVTPVTVGDLMIFCAYISNTALTPSGLTVTGGGVSTWNLVTNVSPSNTAPLFLYAGVVATTGTSTITITYTGSSGYYQDLVADSYTYGGAAGYQNVAGTEAVTTATTTLTLPSLTSPASGSGLYWAYEDGNSPTGLTGFTTYTSLGGSTVAYNPSLANSTVYSPTATMTSTTYGVVAAIFAAATASRAFVPRRMPFGA